MEALFEPLTGPFTGWVAAHAAWAGPLVFLIAFAESLVIVSALMPATILLLAIGTLAGPGGPLDLLSLCAWGTAGAGLGFWLSYELGRWWSARILAIGWLARRPELVAKGHAFFARWGIAAVFVARFVGPARVVVPLLAGALGERPRGFHLGNWLSAIVWTPLLLAPTAAANWVSEQIESLPPSMRAPTVIALIAIAVIVWRAWRERVGEKR